MTGFCTKTIGEVSNYEDLSCLGEIHQCMGPKIAETVEFAKTVRLIGSFQLAVHRPIEQKSPQRSLMSEY